MASISLKGCLAAPIFVSLFACRPEVPLSRTQGDPAPTQEDPTLTAEPSAPLDSIPPVVRLHVTAPGVDINPEGVVLIHGHATTAHLRQVQRRQISGALTKRIVPALVFPEAAGTAGMVVAPTVVLAPGERYVLAVAEPGLLFELTVAEHDPAALLERVWPLEGRSGTGGFGVWCGKTMLPAVDEPALLSPDEQAGRMRRGASVDDPGQRCVRFEASSGQAAEGGVPPPLLPHGEPAVRLDPRPLSADAAPEALSPVECAPHELAFGPGCATVFDDRLRGRSPKEPALWTIQGAGIDRVFTTGPGDPFVISALVPDTTILLDVSAIDNQGAPLHTIFSATTLSPMPHVVLNEVFANPIGPEPAQEWVEIVNDGSAPAELSGYVLVDVGGETVLPSATLEPGRFALIVNEAFVEDDGYDPAPAPSTLILRVPKLGKDGLSNGGEPLKLRDPQGAVISGFPASPQPKTGMSLARRDPAAPDALPLGFTVAAPSPGRANEP